MAPLSLAFRFYLQFLLVLLVLVRANARPTAVESSASRYHARAAYSGPMTFNTTTTTTNGFVISSPAYQKPNNYRDTVL